MLNYDVLKPLNIIICPSDIPANKKLKFIKENCA